MEGIFKKNQRVVQRLSHYSQQIAGNKKKQCWWIEASRNKHFLGFKIRFLDKCNRSSNNTAFCAIYGHIAYNLYLYHKILPIFGKTVGKLFSAR
nr:hypothetical protein [Providencia sp. PROV266]